MLAGSPKAGHPTATSPAARFQGYAGPWQLGDSGCLFGFVRDSRGDWQTASRSLSVFPSVQQEWLCRAFLLPRGARQPWHCDVLPYPPRRSQGQSTVSTVLCFLNCGARPLSQGVIRTCHVMVAVVFTVLQHIASLGFTTVLSPFGRPADSL